MSEECNNRSEARMNRSAKLEAAKGGNRAMTTFQLPVAWYSKLGEHLHEIGAFVDARCCENNRPEPWNRGP